MSKSNDDHYITAAEAVSLLGSDGERKLFRAAQAGKVTLLGRPEKQPGADRSVMRVPIPTIYFANPVVLNLETGGYEGDAGGEILDFRVFETNVAVDRWGDVVAARREISALNNALASREEHSAAAERRCLAWLTEEMVALASAPRTKAAYRIEAKKSFGVGANGFNRMWARAIHDTGRTGWAKAGRKPRAKSAT